jgi:hypothetical protein
MTGVGLGMGVSGVFVRMMAGMVYLVMVVFFVVSVVRYRPILFKMISVPHNMATTIMMVISMWVNMRFFLLNTSATKIPPCGMPTVSGYIMDTGPAGTLRFRNRIAGY